LIGQINKRGESVDEKIRKLDEELGRYKEQIRRTRPGPSQDDIKARAVRLLKHKRMYEEQRTVLYNQTYNLDQVGFAADGIKDAQQTVRIVYALLYLLNFYPTLFRMPNDYELLFDCSDECDEGREQGAEGDDENC
jgi:hypothetical protein